jgi:hypothetical protein
MHLMVWRCALLGGANSQQATVTFVGHWKGNAIKSSHMAGVKMQGNVCSCILQEESPSSKQFKKVVV